MFRARSDLQPFLNRLISRSRLTEEEQEAILALPSHAAQVGANRDFVHLGELVDHATIVLDGIAARFGQTAAGERSSPPCIFRVTLRTFIQSCSPRDARRSRP